MAAIYIIIPVVVFVIIFIVILTVIICACCAAISNTHTTTTIQRTEVTAHQVPSTQTTVIHQHSPVVQKQYTTTHQVQPIQPIYGPPPPQQGIACLICHQFKQPATIIPCGHDCVCLDCGSNLRNNGGACPACNVLIESVWPK